MDTQSKEKESEFYGFKEVSIDEKEVDLSQFKGTVCLVVNTACNCGLASSSYEIIRNLHKEYKDLNILLFPSALNKFIDQEEKDAALTLKRLEEVDIHINSKITVFRKGVIDSSKGLFHWLTNTSSTKGFLNRNFIYWNFTMFLVNKTGTEVLRHNPTVKYKKISEDTKRLLEE